MWRKVMNNGEIIVAPTVDGPGFSLDQDDTLGTDGWEPVSDDYIGTVGVESTTQLTVTDTALSEWEAANRNPATNTINEIKAANLAFISAIRMGQSPIDSQ